MPLSVWKNLGLPDIIPTRMTLELANRAICTLVRIARDVFIPVGKFTFPANFVIVDYESDHRVPLILGRPFLLTARALIDVHGEEMIIRDGDERLTLNMRHDNSSYSNQPQKESINLINVFNNSSEDFLEDLFSTNQPSGNPTFSSHPELTSPEVQHDIFDLEGCNVLPEKLLDLDSTKDLHPPLHVNPLSGSTTYSYSSNPFLEELVDELVLITFPVKNDDDLQFDVESNLKEIEFMLHQDKYSSLKDSIDQSNLTNIFVDSMPEMFVDEHALDYSSPPIFDEYDDDFLEVESDAKNVFNLVILTQEKPFEIITRVVQDKKLATSNASSILEDFDPPLYEPLFFKEVPSEDFLEDLFPKQPIGNPTFSLHQEITSPEVTHEIHDSEGCNVLSEQFLDIDSFIDIHPHFDDNPLSGSTTYSSNSLLEEFTDELALITYPLDYDDNLQFDIESDLREIEFLLYQGKDSGFKDSIDQTDLANLDDYFVDPTPEMFTNEHAPDYSSPPRFDVYDDDFLEVESDAHNFYDDPFDFKGEKIKEVDELPSLNNEDKVFNLGILIHEKSVTIITCAAQEKKLAISKASLVFEDFDPPFYEPIFFKDVPKSMMLLLFSSENEEKVFKPGIYTSEKVHSFFFPELSHPGYHVFKVNQIFISLMKIFHVQCGKNTPLLDVLLFHFIPLDEFKYGEIWSSISENMKTLPMDFVLKSSSPLFKLGITYPNLIELTFILWPT
uniref:Reverse transcriptase domain-containing protein n=1 Tax=Tanacetum cinerariifolium TaxID=118510 RepID=A0A6L2L862_TANCI|nr:reverse transcriptase domain-containing protein [Tanacetum cinerariifolium]